MEKKKKETSEKKTHCLKHIRKCVSRFSKHMMVNYKIIKVVKVNTVKTQLNI